MTNQHDASSGNMRDALRAMDREPWPSSDELTNTPSPKSGPKSTITSSPMSLVRIVLRTDGIAREQVKRADS
jgi:hypothetical protein